MAPMVSTIEVACTPEEVFDVATDPRRFAEWQHDVVNVRMLGEARFATTRRISGAEHTMIQQITRNDPPHGWAVRGIDGPIRPNATITVEPVNGGTRVTSHLHPRLRRPRNRRSPATARTPTGAQGRSK